MIDAYPLQWPAGWPRNQYPEYSRFKTGLASARDNVLRQLELLGATNVVISSNAFLNRDGSIAYRQPKIEDTGVAVYFNLNGQQQCIPCDKWKSLEENVHAIGLTIEALRGLERWGAKEMVDAAFSGFKALPSPSVNEHGWWSVLGVSKHASLEEIRMAHKLLRKKHHPDMGGDSEQFIRVNDAYQEAMKNYGQTSD